MKEKDFTEKNLKIRDSLAQTRAKRKSQICRVFDLKINESKLSKRQKEDLKMQFVESKWLYNDILNWCKEDPLNKPSNYKIRSHCESQEHEWRIRRARTKISRFSKQTSITAVDDFKHQDFVNFEETRIQDRSIEV